MKWRAPQSGDAAVKPVVITIAHPKSRSVVVGGAGYSAGGALGAEEEEEGWVTVMGLPVLAGEGAESSAHFLDAFQQAAEEAGARYLLDAFDSATMVLRAPDLRAFLKRLDPRASGF